MSAKAETRRGAKGDREERRPDTRRCAWSGRRRRSGGGLPAVSRANRREGGGMFGEPEPARAPPIKLVTLVAVWEEKF